jgi:hypothetical protein
VKQKQNRKGSKYLKREEKKKLTRSKKLTTGPQQRINWNG